MAKSKAELELAKLKEDNKKLAKEKEQLRKDNEDLIKAHEELKSKIKAEKEAAKKQREEKTVEQVKGMKAKLDAEPHRWVRVFNAGLDEGVDFGFRYEGVQFKLYSGKPIELAESVISHLIKCGRPKAKLKQGEAGQAVKEEGFHHNYNVVPCEAPTKEAVKVAS